MVKKMFLELCGNIIEKDGGYLARFQPEKYEYLRDPRFSAQKIVPEYIVIESLSQMACRSCKVAFSKNYRMVPVQLNDLKFYKKVIQVNKYNITATIEKKKLFFEAVVILKDVRGNIYVQGNIIIAQMKYD
jgi:hypothetical protein